MPAQSAARSLPAATSGAQPESAFKVRQRNIVFNAEDNFPLAGTLFEGDGEKPLVLISSATAVPRGLYAAFAQALVRAGARAVLIYDYRGTGDSKRPQGWSKRLGMKDWGTLDMPAAVNALDAAAPGHAMVGIGQSFGGHALGLSGMAARFMRYGFVSSMSGYHRNLDDRWAGPRMFVVGVPLSLLFRDIPRWMGLGEPIPGTVFRDWARWCRMPNYFFDDPKLTETRRFAEVNISILSIGITDDVWGTPRAIKALVDRYENAPSEQIWLSPQDAGGKPIGHLGFFRSRFSETLWPSFIGWVLDGTAMPATAMAG